MYTKRLQIIRNYNCIKTQRLFLMPIDTDHVNLNYVGWLNDPEVTSIWRVGSLFILSIQLLNTF